MSTSQASLERRSLIPPSDHSQVSRPSSVSISSTREERHEVAPENSGLLSTVDGSHQESESQGRPIESHSEQGPSASSSSQAVSQRNLPSHPLHATISIPTGVSRPQSQNARPQSPNVPRPVRSLPRMVWDKVWQYITYERLLWFFSLAALVITSVYVMALVSVDGPLKIFVPLGASWPLAILVISTEIVTILLVELYSLVLERIGWSCSTSARGVTLASFLGISPTTSFEGLWGLATHSIPMSQGWYRLWILAR